MSIHARTPTAHPDRWADQPELDRGVHRLPVAPDLQHPRVGAHPGAVDRRAPHTNDGVTLVSYYLLLMLGVMTASFAAGDVLGMQARGEMDVTDEMSGMDTMDVERVHADNMMMINGMAAMAFGLVMVW